MSSLGRICPEVLEKKISKFVNAFFLFCNYLPFEKGLDLHFKKLNPMLSAKFVWKCPSGSGKEDFKKFTIMYFYYSAIISLWEGRDPTFEKKLESSPKNALCQDWLKKAQWFLRRKFLKFSMYFSYFPIISPLRRVWPFIWTT